MKFTFYKYQGTGNDFVMIDNRDMRFPKSDESLVNHICDRHFGIGADGLILLEEVNGYDFKMVYYNSDGKQSTMCGNGGRCLAAFAYQLDIVKDRGTFLAVDGPHPFELKGKDIVKLKMKDVDTFENLGSDFILNTGSPHFVRFTEKVMELDLVKEARAIRYNERFAQEGINVNFVEEWDSSSMLRTYERGVEDETLSCGTGTVAAALSLAIKNDLSVGPIPLHTKGGVLSVYFEKEHHTFVNVWLQGPAKLVFEGLLDTTCFEF
jgi:diaminopimelate epimerase